MTRSGGSIESLIVTKYRISTMWESTEWVVVLVAPSF